MAGTRDEGRPERKRDEHHEIPGGQRGPQHAHPNPDRVAGSRARQQAVQSQDRQRQPIEMQGLEVREPRQHRRAEREQRAGQQAGPVIASPGDDQHVHRKCRQGEPEKHEDVVGEHG